MNCESLTGILLLEVKATVISHLIQEVLRL